MCDMRIYIYARAPIRPRLSSRGVCDSALTAASAQSGRAAQRGSTTAAVRVGVAKPTSTPFATRCTMHGHARCARAVGKATDRLTRLAQRKPPAVCLAACSASLWRAMHLARQLFRPAKWHGSACGQHAPLVQNGTARRLLDQGRA